MPTIAMIDPGTDSGVTIFDLEIYGRFIDYGTIRDRGSLMRYGEELKRMAEKHDIRMAVIEKYVNLGKKYKDASKVQAQIRICEEVFPCRILIEHSQWNPMGYGDRFRRKLAAGIYGKVFENSHVTDAALIGEKFNDFIWRWSRYCGLAPQETAIRIANEFGCIPKRTQLIAWVDEIKRSRKAEFNVGSFFERKSA